MRLKSLSLLFFLILLGCNPNTNKPINQLNKVVSVLNQAPSFEYVAYHHTRQDGVTMKDTIAVFIEKSSQKRRLPLQYVFESASGGIQFFDGQDFKTIIKPERTIINTKNPPEYLIVSNPGLLSSPFYIQSYLKHLLENDRDAITYLGDTLVGNKKASQYEINTDYLYLLDGRIIKNGEQLPNQIKAENIQKKHLLTVDSKSNYPISIKEFFQENDFIEVEFSFKDNGISTYKDRAKDLDNGEYLTLSMEDYMQIQMSKQQEKVGNQAVDFTLPLFPQEEFTLSELKGSPVLLEFWFPGCAFCVNAIPAVNSIFEKYQPQGLKVMGIEFSDAPKERISNYIQTHKILFPTVYKGKSQSIHYGVNAGPTFILLDKHHKIVYTKSGLDNQELITELEKVL